MICEDCIHAEVCLYLTPKYLAQNTEISETIEKECPHFFNKHNIKTQDFYDCEKCACHSFCCLIAEYAGLLKPDINTCKEINGDINKAKEVCLNFFRDKNINILDYLKG